MSERLPLAVTPAVSKNEKDPIDERVLQRERSEDGSMAQGTDQGEADR